MIKLFQKIDIFFFFSFFNMAASFKDEVREEFHPLDDRIPTCRERIRVFDDGRVLFHCEEKDGETGLTLPAQSWRRNQVFSRDIWFYLGHPHNADRDPETGAPLPAGIARNSAGTVTLVFWAIYDSRPPVNQRFGHVTSADEQVFEDPEDPEFLQRLAAWEEEHGVHGVPTVKSAGKQ